MSSLFVPPSEPHRRRRVLFVSEAVTLAQVVRLLQLARSLDRSRYDVHFAASVFDEALFAGSSFQRHALYSLPADVVARKVAGGGRIYGGRTLRRYLASDLEVLDAVKPDLVVGDLRWSLLVSAPLRGVPLASLINAYWSPYREDPTFPLPAHPIVRVLGPKFAAEYFPRALPFVFRHFAAPLNALRRAHGLPEVGALPDLLVAGDVTLHPDPPGLIPLRNAPASHHVMGPVQWAPHAPPPPWWEDVGAGRPAVYVTLGSSGDVRALGRVLEGLRRLPVDVMLATAGRVPLASLPEGVFAAPFLRGDEAARRAAVVVSNGGSTTGYQALAEGTPVVGVPSNLDQHLAMDAIARAGAGCALRSDALGADDVQAAVQRALNGAYAEGTRRVQAQMAGRDGPRTFCALVDAQLQTLHPATAASSAG